MSICSLAYLKQVSSDDKKFITETVNVFIETTPVELALLEQLIAKNKYKEIVNKAHSLKSSLKMMGMDKTSEVSFSLEKLAKQEAASKSLQSQFKIIKNDCSKAYVELVRLIEAL